MGKPATRASSRKRVSSTTTNNNTAQVEYPSLQQQQQQQQEENQYRSSPKRQKKSESAAMFSKKKKNASAASSAAAASSSSAAAASTSSSSSTSAMQTDIVPLDTLIMDMFKEISEDPTDPNAPATMEGIAILGEKLGMDAAEDIRILILLWKLGVGKNSSGNSYGDSNNSFKPGQIQGSEWKKGCKALHINSWESLRSLIPSLDTGFLDTSEFRDFYKFCFRFNLSGTHRTLDSETVVALLHMILGSNNSGRIQKERLDTFCSFLEDPVRGKSYQRLTLDQWMSFWDFCQEIPNNSELLSKTASVYDESTSAWPVMIDEYVEYIQNGK